MEHTKLSRTDASAAVTGLGWRYVLGEFRTEVLTGSLPLAADVAGRAAAVPGAEGHLRMDVRADRVVFSLQTAAAAWVTTRDVELARRLSAVARGVPADHAARGPVGPGARDRHRRAGHPRRSGRSGRRCSATPTSPAGRPERPGRPARAGAGGLVPADGRAAAAAQPDPLRRLGAARRGAPAHRGHAGGRRQGPVRRGGARVLGAGRPRGQRGLHHHLAGPGLRASGPAGPRTRGRGRRGRRRCAGRRR